MIPLLVLFVSLLVFRGLGVLGVPLFLTGILEILGAIGLLIPHVRTAAGICLAILFVAMFPANMNAARKKVPLRGKPATPLWLRLPMQVLFIALALWVALV